jgi:hypothetical protein
VSDDSDEIDLETIECPRCGLLVFLNADRPISQWNRPALMYYGGHLIPDEMGRTRSDRCCEGIRGIVYSRPRWVRFLVWLMS